MRRRRGVAQPVEQQRAAEAVASLVLCGRELGDPTRAVGEDPSGRDADEAIAAPGEHLQVGHGRVGDEHRAPLVERAVRVAGHVGPAGVDVDEVVHRCGVVRREVAGLDAVGVARLGEHPVVGDRTDEFEARSCVPPAVRIERRTQRDVAVERLEVRVVQRHVPVDEVVGDRGGQLRVGIGDEPCVVRVVQRDGNDAVAV